MGCGDRGPESIPFLYESSSSHHPLVDLEALKRVLRDEPVPEEPSFSIVGPYDLWALQMCRERHGMAASLDTPAEYFIWSSGEPANRSSTKLSGVPFLPARTPWPTREGVVAHFHAQLNFADSRDLIPDIPGDVLLVFKFYDSEYWTADPRLYEFVWVDGDEADVIEPGDVPEVRAEDVEADPPYHAARIRLADVDIWSDSIQDDLPLYVESAPVVKIGGTPTDAQMTQVDPDVIPDGYTFLAQTVGLSPPRGCPWPLVNREAELRPGTDGVNTTPSGVPECFFVSEVGEVFVHASCS